MRRILILCLFLSALATVCFGGYYNGSSQVPLIYYRYNGSTYDQLTLYRQSESGLVELDQAASAFSTSDSNLQALWLFENNGTDEQGQNDLSISGATFSTTPTPPRGTYSLYNNGTNYYGASISDASGVNINMSSDFSVGGWFYSNDTVIDGFINKYVPGAGQLLFGRFNSSDESFITIAYGNYTKVDLNGVCSWPASTWVHFVITYNSTSLVLRLYRNGSEITASPMPYTLPSSIYDSSTYFAIGDAPDTTNISRPINGNATEVFIFDKVLTDSEVSQIYQYGFN